MFLIKTIFDSFSLLITDIYSQALNIVKIYSVNFSINPSSPFLLPRCKIVHFPFFTSILIYHQSNPFSTEDPGNVSKPILQIYIYWLLIIYDSIPLMIISPCGFMWQILLLGILNAIELTSVNGLNL